MVGDQATSIRRDLLEARSKSGREEAKKRESVKKELQ